MPSVAFYTLGCKVNFYDTEAIWQLFKNEGYEQVDFDEQTADVYLINTCTVTNTGDKKSRQIIRRAIRRNPDAIVAVTGCYAQTSPAEIMDIPGVDLVIGTQDRDKIIPFVQEIQGTRQPVNAVRNIMKTRVFEEMDVPDFANHTRAFLKIQDGCNNFCTFCIIPWSRGYPAVVTPRALLHRRVNWYTRATRKLCSQVSTLAVMVTTWKTMTCLICCGIWRRWKGWSVSVSVRLKPARLMKKCLMY